MAGESPGKSEQQKSSGETGPDERDARAGVPREAEADGAGVAEANTGARADAGAEADTDAEADAEAAITGSGTPAAPATPGPSGSAEPSATGTRPGTSGSAADGTDSADADDARDGHDARQGEQHDEQRDEAGEQGTKGAVSAAPDSGVDEDADADTAEGAAGSGGGGGGETRAEPEPDPEPEPEADAEAKSEPGTGAGSPSAGPDADASSDESGAKKARNGAEDGSARAQGVEGEAGAAEAPEGAADAVSAPPAARSGADAGDGSGAGPEDAGAKAPAAAAAAAAGTDTDSDGDSGPDSEPGSGSDADSAPAADSVRSAASGGTGTASGSGPVGGVPAQASGEDTPGRSARGGRPAPGGASGGGPGTSGATASSASRTPGWAKGGVDQPTTAIRTVPSPGKQPVDHPTTALKLPSQPPLNGGSTAASAVAGSTFVPLKRDDVPAQPAPVAWPSLPTPQKPGAPGTPGTPGGPGRPGGPITPVIDPERTTQQPVPPREPLDLLAELTNTPDTPVRVVARRFKIWTPLVLLLVIVFVIVQAARPLPAPSLKLTAAATYSFEGKAPQLPWPSEGQGYLAAPGLGTMDSFGKEAPVPVGSVAKLMTAYLVLKDHPLKTGQNGPSITVDKKAEQEGGLDSEGESTLNTVKAGDKLTLKEALSALMVQSANNIARLLARWDAGSEAAFVKKMNAETKTLGMDHTTYTDPSGLKSSTVSTAKDQVILGQKVVGIPALTAITVLPSWTDPSGTSHRNYNSLVPYNGAIGLKTGTTTAAGGNLVFAAHKVVDGKDQLVVGAVFDQHKSPFIDTVNAASKPVMIGAEDVLKRVTVVHKGQVVGEVDDGLGGTVPVVATADAKAVGWGGLSERLQLTAGPDPVPHTAKAGTRVGTLTVGNGLSSTKIPVALQGDLVEPGFGAKLSHF